jgi:type 1 glutamine amidotransferase
LIDLKGYERLVIWTLKKNSSRGFYERLGGQAKFFREITIRGQVLEEVGYEFESLEILKGV